MQTIGFRSGETYRCFATARALALKLGEVDRFVSACNGLAPTLYAAGRFREVLAMVGQLSSEQISDLRPMSRVVRSIHIGIAHLHHGELNAAWTNFSDAISFMGKVEPGDRELCGGAEMEIPVLAYSARTRVLQGFLDQAEGLIRLSRATSDRLDHAATRAWALQMVAWMATVKGDFEQAAQTSLEVIQISDKLGIKTRSATGAFYRGFALVATRHPTEGTMLLHSGYSGWATSGGKFHCSEYAAYAANILLEAGLEDEAMKFVLLGEKAQEESEERLFQAELLRLRGRLLELVGSAGPAEDHFRRAIEVAEKQGAKLLALRAATSLAMLLRSAGREAEGQATLRPVYDWFTEAFDFPDLVRARSVL